MNWFKLAFNGKLIFISCLTIASSVVHADYGVGDFGKPLQMFKGLTSAEKLFPQKKDGTSSYYFVPDSAAFLGKNVEVKSYGFESEKLCYLGFGFGFLNDKKIEELIFQIKKDGYDFKSEDSDMSGGRRIFFESDQTVASLYIFNPNENPSVHYAVSSLKCDKSIAKNKWQTMQK